MIAPRARQTEFTLRPYVERGHRPGKASRRGFKVPSAGVSASAAFALLSSLSVLGRRERCRAGNGPAISQGGHKPGTHQVPRFFIILRRLQWRRRGQSPARLWCTSCRRQELKFAHLREPAPQAPRTGRFCPGWGERHSSVGLFMIWILLLLSPRP